MHGEEEAREGWVCTRSSGGRRGGGDVSAFGDALHAFEPVGKGSKSNDSVSDDLIPYRLIFDFRKRTHFPKTD